MDPKDPRGAAVSKRIVKVTRDQVQSAKALIKLRGGEDNVDPDIVLIARAQRIPPREQTAS